MIRFSRTSLSLLIGTIVAVGCTATHRPTRATVRFDIAADPTTLDPLFAHPEASNAEAQLARLIFEPFYDLDSNGHPVPALLRELPTRANGGLSRDGRTIVYRLRPGVRWSDGVTVTSADVLFTLRAILDARNPVGSREGYDLIDRADALGPYAVRIHLRRAWAPAVATFFAPGATTQYVLPAHILGHERSLAIAPFNAAPRVGDGPYSFARWSRGDRVAYVANARYWRGRPAIDAIDVRIVPSPQTNLALLTAGDLDFNLIAPTQRPALGGHPELAFVSTPTAIIAGLALNCARPPLADVRLRRALAASIDRNAISAKITLGAYPVANSDRPRFSFAFDPNIREPDYDPAAADREFDLAGYRRGPDGRRRRDGRELALVDVQFPETVTGVRAATLVQRELADRGVGLAIKSVSNAQLFLPAREGGILARGAFDLAYVPWPMGADPDDRFLLGCAGGVKNYMHYCNPAIERLERRAIAIPERAPRRAAYRAIDRLVAHDVPIIYLFNPSYVYAYRTTLHGFAPNAFIPTWNAYGWRLR